MTLKQLFAFEFGAKIWRILPGTNPDILVVELRDTINQQSAWLSIGMENGEILADEFAIEPNWWLGLETIVNGKAIFHGFQNNNMPEHQKLIVVNAINGNKLWESREHKFIRLEGPFIVAEKKDAFLPTKLEYLDLEKGKAILNPLFLEGPKITDLDLVIPQLYGQDSPFYADFTSFIRQNSVLENSVPTGQIEYLETSHFFCISWYETAEENKKQLNQYLMVSGLDGKIWINQQTGQNLSGFGQAQFFVFKTVLVLVSQSNFLYAFYSVHG